MGNPESVLQAEIRLALGRDPSLVLWRNSTGTAAHLNPRTNRTTTVRYGLAVGSADLVGILSIDVAIGGAPTRVGRFVALEIKTETGRVRPEQTQWLALVRSRGGFAAVVRSVDEARAAIERARTGASE